MPRPRHLVTRILAPCLLLCACHEPGEEIPPPGPLQIGLARTTIPAPVGIGTCGFNGLGVDSEPSPFARMFPATNRVYGAPELRAMVFSRGPGHEVILLRADMVGVFQQLHRAVAAEVEARLGRKVGTALIMGGTHTHSGPGRLIQGGGVYDIIADVFFPEYYARLVDAAASTVLAAYADLRPARLGHARASAPDGHDDRRCEDGRDHTNDDVPLVLVEREGVVDGVLFAYAVHGTALDISHLTLSRDVAGGVEQHVEAGFDHPVMAMMLNSWGADMSPGSPDVATSTGAPLPDGFERIHRAGRAVADAVHSAIPGATWETEPEIFAEVHQVHLSREAIGYTGDEFPYPFGGVYCGSGVEADCDPTTTLPEIVDTCLGFDTFFEENPLPPQTEIGAGRLGTLALVTLPGEPTTPLAETLLGKLRDRFGAAEVMLLGYALDYTGYIVEESDFWQGGYEASGAMWGPRQGDYLLAQAEAVFERVVVSGPRRGPAKGAPAPADPFVIPTFTPYAPTPAEDVGAVVLDATAVVDATGLIVVTVLGSDPWLGTPEATLVDADGTPVLGANGVPVTSAGYAFWVDLRPVPAYSEERTAASRAFHWTFSMPARLAVPGLLPDLEGGTWRLRIAIPTDGDPVEVTSAAFTVIPD
jgi:hypothetical protein